MKASPAPIQTCGRWRILRVGPAVLAPRRHPAGLQYADPSATGPHPDRKSRSSRRPYPGRPDGGPGGSRLRGHKPDGDQMPPVKLADRRRRPGRSTAGRSSCRGRPPGLRVMHRPKRLPPNAGPEPRAASLLATGRRPARHPSWRTWRDSRLTGLATASQAPHAVPSLLLAQRSYHAGRPLGVTAEAGEIEGQAPAVRPADEPGGLVEGGLFGRSAASRTLSKAADDRRGRPGWSAMLRRK